MGSPNSRRFVALEIAKKSRFHAKEFVSAVIERGSYPFPSRTRKSSLASPMVPGPRIRESRSPLDSRGPLPRRRGASSFYTGRSAVRERRSARVIARSRPATKQSRAETWRCRNCVRHDKCRRKPVAPDSFRGRHISFAFSCFYY